MNVDLYVGTLTRYYSEQWENSRTRAGNRSPFGPQKGPANTIVTDPVELQGALAQWLEEASVKLKGHLKEPLAWQEGMLPPYFIGDLGLEGYGGAVLVAAYTSASHLPRPIGMMKSWLGDPAIESCLKAGANDPLWEIVNCSMWYPVDFGFGIGMKDPSGTPIKAGSLELLWKALEYLNEANWAAGPDDLAAWRAIKLGHTESFDTQARFGFAVFHEMCRLAREHRLPMKLHY